jgi:HAD superfamily hydrolase (TIGR01509 family)
VRNALLYTRLMRAVVLDLYDTLVWTEWSLLRDRLSDALGMSPRDLMRGFAQTHEARGLGTFGSVEGDLAAVLRAAGASPADDQVRALAELERLVLTDGGVHLYDDALPVLRELRRRAIPTAIVSNCDHLTRPIVDALGLGEEVDAVVLSFEVRAMKPDPRIYRIALERIRAEGRGSTFVDDQSAYLDGAAEVGMATLQIVRPTTTDPGPPGPHRVIEDLWAAIPDD